jgi:hypothetical protein
MVMGVSYQLGRMFALAHGHDDQIGAIVFVLLNLSLIGLAISFACDWPPLTLAAGILLIAAVWLFAYDYTRMVRLRRRHVLDITQWHGIVAVAYLAVVMPSAVVVALAHWTRPPILAALGLAVLVGWLGQSTIGYLYKIVPFLIWNTRFGPLVGRQKVPLMRDLLHGHWTVATFWLINLGLPLAVLWLASGWVWPLRVGGVMLGAGLVLAATNIMSVGLRKVV